MQVVTSDKEYISITTYRYLHNVNGHWVIDVKGHHEANVPPWVADTLHQSRTGHDIINTKITIERADGGSIVWMLNHAYTP